MFLSLSFCVCPSLVYLCLPDNLSLSLSQLCLSVFCVVSLGDVSESLLLSVSLLSLPFLDLLLGVSLRVSASDSSLCTIFCAEYIVVKIIDAIL